MKRVFSLLVLIVCVGGCGNLSNEDLIFLAAIPSSHEIALVVENGGAQPNALSVGEPAQFYEQAGDIAHNLNTGVEKILSLVDGLGRGHPATTREDNVRIWGPVSNVDGKDITLRLEIRRSYGESGIPRYEFCLQLGKDADYMEVDVTCDNPDDAGLANALYGHYLPRSVDEGARSGTGEIGLDFDALVDSANQGRGGVFALQYDFTAGGESKVLHIDWSATRDTGGDISELAYDYERTAAGTVDFRFEFRADLIARFFTNNEETATIEATWQEGGLGRADVLLVGGDLSDGESATVIECWDAAHLRTYYERVVTQYPSENLLEGDIASCP